VAASAVASHGAMTDKRPRLAVRLALPEPAVALVCGALGPDELLIAGTLCKKWCSASGRDELWFPLFLSLWQHRHKPGFFASFWHKLIVDGVANPAQRTLTADASRLLEQRCRMQSHTVQQHLHAKSLDEALSWQQRFLLAEADLHRSMLTETELCNDVAFDLRSSDGRSRFPRRWVLVSGAFREDFLGDEMQFNVDRTIEARSCLLLLAPQMLVRWSWDWDSEQTGMAITIATDGTAGEGSRKYDLEVHRAEDGGFVLQGPMNLKLCSREKTVEEHVYRRYNNIQCPGYTRNLLNDVVQGRLQTPHEFPKSLTSFERLTVHRFADRLGLQHDSRGIGLGRHVVVWRQEDMAVEDSSDDETGPGN